MIKHKHGIGFKRILEVGRIMRHHCGDAEVMEKLFARRRRFKTEKEKGITYYYNTRVASIDGFVRSTFVRSGFPK